MSTGIRDIAKGGGRAAHLAANRNFASAGFLVFTTSAVLARALGGPSWTSLVGATFAVVGALLAVVLFVLERRAVRASYDQRTVQARREALQVDALPIETLTPEQLAVDAVDPRILEAALRRDGRQLAYIEREVDRALDDHLRRARDGVGPCLVCLIGATKSGKSRTLFEAARRSLPRAVVVMPRETRKSLQVALELGTLGEAAARSDCVVLWLEDLESFARVSSAGLGADDVAPLKKEIPGLVILATAGGRGAMNERVAALVEHGVSEEILPTLVAEVEREALPLVLPPDLVARVLVEGLGPVAVAGRRLVDVLVREAHPRVSGGRACPEGAALVWAAVVAYRFGRTEPLPIALLRRLFGCFVSTATDARFAQALHWATTPLYAEVALLRGSDVSLAPHEYLVQFAPEAGVTAAARAWKILLDDSRPQEALELAFAALDRDAIDDAEAAFRRASDAGEVRATLNLGVLLEHERKDLHGAEAAFRQVDATGDPTGSLYLGILLRHRGDRAEAEAAFRRALKRGLADGAVQLAILFYEEGDTTGGVAAIRQAEEMGAPQAAGILGVFLAESGDKVGARSAFRRAMEAGDLDGIINFGRFLIEDGATKAALEVFKKADELGSADGAIELGVLLGERDVDAAEAAFQRADKRGHPEAAERLTEIKMVRARAALDAGDFDQARVESAEALRLFGRFGSAEGVLVASVLDRLAQLLASVTEYEAARLVAQRALTVKEALYPPEDPEIASTLNRLAHAVEELGEHEEALTHHRRALTIQSGRFGEESVQAAIALCSVGNSLMELGDFPAAQSTFERSLEILESQPTHKAWDRVRILTALARCHARRHDPERSLHHNERALEILLALSAPTAHERHARQASLAVLLKNTGDDYDELGDPTTALERHRRALDIFTELFGQEHPDVARAHGSIAGDLATLGDNKAAEFHSQQALAIHEAVYGPQHPAVAGSHINLGFVLASADHPKRAYSHFRTAREIFTMTLGPDHPDSAVAQLNFGNAAAQLGRHDEARRALTDALRVFENIFGDDDVNTGYALLSLADLMAELGDEVMADEYRRRAAKLFGEDDG